MKKSGILNPGLLSFLASVGHTDYFGVYDRGFPIPASINRIDLSLVDDIPTVLDVLRAVDQEFVIDRIIVTEEMHVVSSGRLQQIEMELPMLRIDTVSHLELKALTLDAKGAIRTADTCPYANLLIVSG